MVTGDPSKAIVESILCAFDDVQRILLTRGEIHKMSLKRCSSNASYIFDPIQSGKR